MYKFLLIYIFFSVFATALIFIHFIFPIFHQCNTSCCASTMSHQISVTDYRTSAYNYTSVFISLRIKSLSIDLKDSENL